MGRITKLVVPFLLYLLATIQFSCPADLRARMLLVASAGLSEDKGRKGGNKKGKKYYKVNETVQVLDHGVLCKKDEQTPFRLKAMPRYIGL